MNLVTVGGGTNSLAMILEMHRRGIPINECIFADTKAEKPSTYRSLDALSKWLVNHGYKPLVVVSTEKTLEEDCLIRNALPSIAYGFKSCSQRFKLAPQDKWANHYEPFKKLWVKGEKVTKFIGFDAGEHRRADNAYSRNKDDKKYNFRYPLIEWNINRDKCIEIIKEAGFEQPGKSSCFFCPNMRKNEILILRKEDPELLKRAITMEKNADLKTIKGLGRNFSWEEYIWYKENQLSMFDEDKFEDEDFEFPCECWE